MVANDDTIRVIIKLNDCIRNTIAVCNPRQNPRENPGRDKIQSEKKSEKKIFLSEKNCQKKNLSWMLSRISSAQSELSRTNRCLSSLSGIYIPQ